MGRPKKEPTFGCIGAGPGEGRCPNPVKAKGMCWPHYQRFRRSGTVTLEKPVRPARREGHDIQINTRVSSIMHRILKAEADRTHHGSVYDLARDILEEWAKERPSLNVKIG